MRIAIEGCAHGELEIIYDSIQEIERIDGKTIDLLICCGDFQSTRNLSDLECMAVPDKYKDLCTFYKYYSGEKVTPVLTLFIGGNHEASNYLQELPYGGWVAHNIYYLGYGSVVSIRGVRIAGISGIYKGQDFMQGHFEIPPYTQNTIRSVYHIRNLEIFRMKQLSEKIDIFLSHDWPRGITKHGDEEELLRKKPFFRNDIESNVLGSPPCMDLLQQHYPSYWFSAHLHCKFAAVVSNDEGSKVTKFLALDKCLPNRKYLQIIEIDHNEKSPMKLSYDLEWLTILHLTNHLLSIKSGLHYMPSESNDGRWRFTPTEQEKEMVLKKFNYNLEIPLNFKQTVSAYVPDTTESYVETPKLVVNEQTTQLCDTLGIDDPSALLKILIGNKDKSYPDEISINSLIDSSQEFCDNSIILGDTDDSSISSISKDNPFSNNSSHSMNNADNSDTEALCQQSLEISEKEVELASNKEDNASTPLKLDCKRFKGRNHSMYSSTL